MPKLCNRSHKKLKLLELKTLKLMELKTLKLMELKTLKLMELKTLKLMELKTLKLMEQKILKLMELKTPLLCETSLQTLQPFASNTPTDLRIMLHLPFTAIKASGWQRASSSKHVR